MDNLNQNNNNDMSGEAALVVAARVGQTSALKQLITSQHHPPNLSQQSAALYAAARAGQLEAVKFLIDVGVNVDSGEPEPPLLGALAGGHAEVAMLLIHYGADSDVKDTRGNSCLHLACASGLYNVVRSLCALGCVQGPNNRGQYPLHVAARHGHVNIVRLLCFYGCKIDQKNGDGIRADITALKYGHNHVAELLDKLRLGHISTSALRSQLLPGARPISRLQVKLFGHSGAGKTTLAASLNAGLLQQFFRRSTSLTTRSRPSSPSQSSHIEMDITHRYSSLSFDSCSTSNYVPTKGINVQQMDLSGVGDLTVWDFSGQENFFQLYHHFISDVSVPLSSSIFSQVVSKSYTKNHNANEVAKYTAGSDNVVTSVVKRHGDCNFENLTECSKYFCKSSTVCSKNKQSKMAVYVIMFSLEKTFNVQLQQCIFWLNFIMSRLSPCSCPGGLGNVILVGSHADLRAHRTCNGDFIYNAGDSLLQELNQMFHPFFRIHHQVLVLDCNAANSVGIKNLKCYLSTIKRNISHGCEAGGQHTTVFGSEYNLIRNSPAKQKQTPVGNWSGFLEGTLIWVHSMRKLIETFPVMEKRTFMEHIRSHVNLLASDEHIIDVIQNLHLIGEVLAVGESIVLCCEWLCNVLGTLLGRGGLRGARALGVYTAHDFQAYFGYCDASQLLALLQEMQLCTMCEVDEEIEYEFPSFNSVEMLEGLWDPDDPRYKTGDSCYGGMTLHQAQGLTHLLASVFPHVQVELRNDMEMMKMAEREVGDFDLYQWWHGSKMCWGSIESILTLEGCSGGEYLQFKIRGPPTSGVACFFYQHRVLTCINKALNRVAPGLVLEKFILSPQQLRLHCEEPFCWSSSNLVLKILSHGDDEQYSTIGVIQLSNDHTGKKETLQSLLCFDDQAVAEFIVWCPRVTMREVDTSLLTKLSAILDPPHELGAHWCMLAIALGVSQESIASMDSATDIWHTQKLLTSVNCDIRTLYDKLSTLGRMDATSTLINFSPIYTTTSYQEQETSSGKSSENSITSLDYSSSKPVEITGSKIHTDV